MRNKARVQHHPKPQPPVHQAKTSGSGLMLLLIDTRKKYLFVQMSITAGQWQDIKENHSLVPDYQKSTADLRAQDLSKLAEWHRNMADNLDRYNGTETDSPASGKIPKGFVLVNLAAWQQKQLRALANRSGITLRGALGWALSLVRQHLESSARIKDITGMNAHDWHEKFGRKVSLN